MAKKILPYTFMDEYLAERYIFTHNTVLNKIQYQQLGVDGIFNLDDYKLNSILGELLRGGIDVSKSTLLNHLYSEQSEQIDPFKAYFASLEEWQPGQPDYIQLLAETITVPGDHRALWNTYLRRWLIATVACAIDPNVTNQQVLVLVGEQGVGKTKWTETLVPETLKNYYYSGNVNPGDKDSSINLSECFLINLDELGNLNRGDLNSLKQLITQSCIRMRRPYAAMAEKMPRRASFVGSVNNQEFLRDDTGNRRYLCAETLNIDYNHGINMDLVYAQAYHLFNNGEKYWFEGEEVKEINTFNNQYKVQYPELEYVNQFYEPCDRNEPDAVELTLTELQNELARRLKREGVNLLTVSNRTLGIAMKASEYVRVKKNGGSYYYRLKKRKKEAL